MAADIVFVAVVAVLWGVKLLTQKCTGTVPITEDKVPLLIEDQRVVEVKQGVQSLASDVEEGVDTVETNLDRTALRLSSLSEDVKSNTAQVMRTREHMDNKLAPDLLRLNLRFDRAHNKQDTLIQALRLMIGSNTEQTRYTTELPAPSCASIISVRNPTCITLPSSTFDTEAQIKRALSNAVNEYSRPEVEERSTPGNVSEVSKSSSVHEFEYKTGVCDVEATEPEFPRLILNSPREILLKLILTPEALLKFEGLTSATSPETASQVEEGIISAVRAGLFTGKLSKSEVEEVHREIDIRQNDEMQQARIPGRRLEGMKLPCPKLTPKEDGQLRVLGQVLTPEAWQKIIVIGLEEPAIARQIENVLITEFRDYRPYKATVEVVLSLREGIIRTSQ